MPLHITQRDIEEAHRYARDAMGRLKGYGQAGGTTERAVAGIAKGLEVCAGAAAVGLLSGKFGSADLKIGDKAVPLDLLGGLALKGVATFMDNSQVAEHLDNFSTGVLAAFVTKWSVGLGRSWAEKAPAAIAGAPSPRMFAAPTTTPAPLSADELARMAQAIR